MTETNKDTSIQLKDLAAVVRIIDECTKRGAFRGEEMTSVGEVRDKISNFLRASQEASQEQQQNKPAEINGFLEPQEPEFEEPQEKVESKGKNKKDIS